MPLAARAFILGACLSLIALTVVAGTITGTVTSAETQQPLRSMVVAAYDVAGSLRATATTDGTGLFILLVPAGRYRVLAYDPAGAYATAFDGGADSYDTTPFTDLGATETRNLSFALPTAGSVSGMVLSPTGSSVPNAIVAAYNFSGTQRGFTTANAQGSYSLVLPPGSYKLVAFDQGGAYAAAFYRDAQDFASANAVAVAGGAVTSGVDFRLGVAARATGTVIDAATGLPLPSIDVYAYTESGAGVATVTTDASGVFRLALPQGRYRVVAADAERVYATSYYAGKRSFATADVLELAAGQTTPGVQFALSRAGILAGRVTDASVTPLAQIVVAAYNADGTLHTSTTTAADGRWELVVAPGAYRVAAFDLGLNYATELHPQGVIQISSGERLMDFDFALDRGGRYAGVVTDAVTNQRLAGIRIAAYDSAGFLVGQATTRADGSYAMVVPAGAHRLLAFDVELRYATAYPGGAKNFETTAPKAVAVDATQTVDFVLVRGVKVTGTVTDRNGAPVNGIDIVALDMSGNHVAAATANAGAFAIVVLPATYRFVAHDPFGRFVDGSSTLTVSEGQSPVVTFVLSGATRRRSTRH